MTFEGTLQKIAILFGLATLSAVGSVALGFIMPGLLYPMMLLGMFGTMGMGIYLWFSRPVEPVGFVMARALEVFLLDRLHWFSRLYILELQSKPVFYLRSLHACLPFTQLEFSGQHRRLTKSCTRLQVRFSWFT